MESNTKSTPTKKINKISFSEQGFSIGDQNDRSSTSSPTGIIRSHWKMSHDVVNLCKICKTNLNVKNGIVNCRKCGELFCNNHTHYQVRLRNPEFNETLPQYDSTGIWCRCCELCYLENQKTHVMINERSDEFKSFRDKYIDINDLERIKVQRNFLKLVNEDRQVDEWKQGTNCSICFVKFSLFIRKHHCRLCGDLVCDDPNGFRQSCSMYLPIIRLVELLPNLNYEVRPEQNKKFRCCINCKNNLLFNLRKQADKNELVERYLTIQAQRHQIEIMLEKYKLDERIGHRLMINIKEYEKSVLNFRTQFFTNEMKVIQVENEQLTKNMYQSMAMFLQESLIQYKESSAVYIPPPSPEPIKQLTKKEVRELREQLMVLNEQKFLIENMIQQYTKSRRFDELNSLISNKQELQDTITEVEIKLGEHAFL